ncbi:uncharacterized protein LOC115229986 [Octopus sinensis]|uniref:Uncharacterized protein LOC115229986 n=1 Tax=Octopus sinensis TaxID=2607531 RepID=A0A7E6EJA4_9MOLL|nr:uncharacterized protein LOC115229986 [Octopus sinensis]
MLKLPRYSSKTDWQSKQACTSSPPTPSTANTLQHSATLPSPKLASSPSSQTYEDQLMRLIGQHLHLCCRDKLCYVGEEDESLVETISEEFQLITPPKCLSPRSLFTSVRRNTSIDEYFSTSSTMRTRFNRLLVVHCYHKIDNFKWFLQSIFRDFRIMVIARPPALNTLPALPRAGENYHIDILRDLKSFDLDIDYQVGVVVNAD